MKREEELLNINYKNIQWILGRGSSNFEHTKEEYARLLPKIGIYGRYADRLAERIINAGEIAETELNRSNEDPLEQQSQGEVKQFNCLIQSAHSPTIYHEIKLDLSSYEALKADKGGWSRSETLKQGNGTSNSVITGELIDISTNTGNK